MEVRIDPRAEMRRQRDDWAGRAHKVLHAPMVRESFASGLVTRPDWVVVMIDREQPAKGRASYVKAQLRRYGVVAEVRSLRGVPGSRDRNWDGWVTFARLVV